MVHSKVYEYFKAIFPGGLVDKWFPAGYNAVRIRYKTGREVVFIYEDSNKWCLETLEYFIERVEKIREQNKIKN